MNRAGVLFVLGATLISVCPTVNGKPALARQLLPQMGTLPVGRWQITFDNGVVEKCVVKADGTAHETEPLRESTGKAVVENNSTFISFEDDRLERWTVIDGQMIVEHWCPASAYPASRAVIGVAKLTR